ncbi:tetratricopeptide repeat protein [Nocardiopsis sp. HNM0947]|uniref:Tetratricopeptide repeat protein n=1 Tax=Nocardiopsis coralli TaxID=2772213 RepID=A0ABR9P2A2_9ACTN|nr:tetratricopeptide repeat protein [Nocardiopsis coralli]MBE2997964.1 tetratricopeptide repeat protein [Nocardiopsis coralli]
MSTEGNNAGNIGGQARVVQVQNLHGNVTVAEPPERRMHSNLPPANRLFTDREYARARVRRLVHQSNNRDGVTLVKLHGAPGVGTSELARYLAFELADHYRDAQMGIDLGGPEPDRAVPAEALLDRLLLLCDVRSDQIPASPAAKRDLFVRLTDGKAFVLVLDNAVSAGQIRALLPARSRCLLLATSPNALPRVGNVEKELPVHVGDMENEAVTEILLRGMAEAEAGDLPEDALHRLVNLCHGLPALAHIALGYLEHNPFATTEDLIAHLEAGGEGGPRDRVAAYVSALSEQELRVFRTIGAHTALGLTVDQRAVEAALGNDPYVRQDLNKLAQLSLLHKNARNSVWFTVGSLVGDVALERAGSAGGERSAQIEVLRRHYRDTAVRAASLLTRRPLLGASPELDDDARADERTVAQARDWLSTAVEVLTAVVRRSADAGDHTTVIATAEAASVYLAESGRNAERVALLAGGLEAATAADDVRARIRFGNLLGLAHMDRGAFDEAEALVVRSLELAEPAGDPMERAAAHEVLGLVSQRRGDHTRAVEGLLRVRELKEGLDRPQALAVTDLLIARSLIELGRCGEARDRLESALPVFSEPGQHRAPDAVNVAKVRMERGRALLGLGEREEAEAELREALNRFAELDIPLQRARTLEALADAAQDARARDEYLTAAAGLHRDVGDVAAAERVEAERDGTGE